MSESVALGNGPITLTTQDGTQLLIPLSDLFFDATNTIQATNWPLYAKYKADVDPWLQYLVTIGTLTAGSTSAPKPAMVIKAADPGAAGNNIQVVFSNIQVVDPNDSSKTTFDATITETDTYNGLSFDPASTSFIQTVLGKQSTNQKGSQPGLVSIKDIPVNPPPPPKAKTYKLASGGAAPSFVSIDGDPAGKAFIVEAKKDSPEGDNTTVIISDVDKDKKTFTLVAKWIKSIPGLHPTDTDLPDKLDGGPPQYEIKVSKPDGGAFAIPAPGPVVLSGGAEAKDASNAHGTAFVSQS